MDPKKIANNILEFMFDPTVIPVEKRLYFRPEENLQNADFDKAKKDAEVAYGDQKHNSNFYPTRKTTLKEASIMDRKTLVASLDVLSQNFGEEDPIGKDLRTMAYAVSKMAEEEFGARMAKGKAEMVSCPDCGGKVLKATGYCLHCKKKINEKAAATKCEKCGKEVCGCGAAEACKEAEWSKEASDAVAKVLLADVLDIDMPEKKPAKPAPKVEEKKVAEAPAEPVKPEEKIPAEPAKPEEKAVAEPVKKEASVKEVDAVPEEPKDASKIVDTSILATSNIVSYDGFEFIDESSIDTTELTASDKAQLDQLFK